MKIVAAALAAVGLTAACSSGSGAGKIVTVTVPPPTPSKQASPSASSTATRSLSPSPTGQTKFPGTCDDLLPDYAISQALGGKQLTGTDAFVVGVPEKGIGRLAYLNCRYGVTGKGAAAVPKVEIGVSLYETAQQATTRISATEQDYTAHGATATDTRVGSLTATYLTGGVGKGYDAPTLVVASGRRTVAVSIAPTVATGTQARTDAVAVAKLTLDRTAG